MAQTDMPSVKEPELNIFGTETHSRKTERSSAIFLMGHTFLLMERRPHPDRTCYRMGQAQSFLPTACAAVIASHHIAIDGTLKQDSSTVNDLSAFSYKARKKGCQEVSALYAYDIEAMEPICAEVFPGNGIDARIANNGMLSFEGVLSGVDDHVLYKKSPIQGGRYLNAYRSARKAAAEEASYLARRERQKDFQPDAYEKKRSVFGVIVFESDQDIAPKAAYLCYDDRWLLELVFNRYKSDECLDKTDVQGDFWLIGSEFINFISTALTCRMLRKARETGLLEKVSYGELLDALSSAWRMVDSPEDPATDDGFWVHTQGYVFDELEALGLSKPVPKPAPKKRGRPRKNPVENKPKRPRERPRKTPNLSQLYSTADWETYN